jgi:hypothetical protein
MQAKGQAMAWKKWAAVTTLTGMGLASGMAGEAQAYYRRQSATFCTPITSTYQYVQSDSGAIGNGSTSPIRLVCPILDDAYLSKTVIGASYVTVNDGSTSAAVDARACVTYSSSVGGTCGPASATSSTGTGLSSLYVNPGIWAGFPYEYGYIVVNLPGTSSGRVSSVHGYDLYD